MHCERAQEFFSDYLEQTLDPPMTGALEAHLSGCGGCRDGVRRLRETYLSLEALPEVEPGEELTWHVLRELRRLRAEEAGARRRHSSWLEMLRSLSPARVAVGAGLATLVVGGAFLVSGVPSVQNNPLVLRTAPRPAPERAPAAPALRAALGPVTAAGQQVDLRLEAIGGDLRGVRLEVSGGTGPYTADATLAAGHPIALEPVVLPRTAEAGTIRVSVTAGETRSAFMVVVPLAPAPEGALSLFLVDQPLSEVLLRLAPALGWPVVVEVAGDPSVTIEASGRSAREALREIAAQAGAELRVEDGCLRLVPAP